MLDKTYPVPFDFEEHRKAMYDPNRAMWKTFLRDLKGRNR